MINNLDHNIVKNLDIKKLNFLYLFVMGMTNSIDNKNFQTDLKNNKSFFNYYSGLMFYDLNL